MHEHMAAQLKMAPLSGIPSLFVLPGAEEYAPDNSRYRAMCGRLAGAAGPLSSWTLIEGGDHVLKGKETEAAQCILNFCLEAEKQLGRDNHKA